MSPIFIEVTLFNSKKKRVINMMEVIEFGPSFNPANVGGTYVHREGGGIEIAETFETLKRATSAYHLPEA